MIQSLERSRAEKAVSQISTHRKLNRTQTEFWSTYCNAANALPMAIRQQGIARGMAMGLAKAKKPGHLDVLDDICKGVLEWYNTAGRPSAFKDLTEAIDKDASKYDEATMKARVATFIENAIALDFWSYTVLQRECMEILAWLKTLSAPHNPPAKKNGKSASGGPGVEDGLEGGAGEGKPA
jgi:CRISPR/Cas system CMR-associated protein Cmr5 small subunit